MSVSIDLTCGARVHRDFQILLDPISTFIDVPGATALRNAPPKTVGGPRVLAGNSSSALVPGRASDNQTTTVDGNKRRDLTAAEGKRVAVNLAPLAPIPRSASSRNVLKLSSQELTAAELASLGQLKLTSQLAEPVSGAGAPSGDDLAAARRRYAMVLRGEDPIKSADQESLTQQNQITTLKQQSDAGNARHVADQAAFDDLQKNSMSLGWFAGLAALLLGSIGVAGWLGWRLKNLYKQPSAIPWDVSILRNETGTAAGATESADRADQAGPVPFGLFGAGRNPVRTVSAEPEFLQVRDEPEESHSAGGIAETTGAAIGKTDSPVSVVHETLQFYPARVEHLKVEEISDVMQEAEFWVSLNDPGRAIEILEPYGNLEQPESPMPWLFLLDLYRDCDNQTSYEALRERTIRIFNTRIPGWDEVPDVAPAASLENFPHVVEQISALWETEQILPYLESLVLDKRDGIRRGFDIEVYQEIMLLLSIARGFGPARRAGAVKDMPDLTLE
ncbi:hypothetical protein [Actimicrobium sp. CCC2.4]|nr:hypothetical protein [Actimicrobium sp. CCC2.4]